MARTGAPLGAPWRALARPRAHPDAPWRTQGRTLARPGAPLGAPGCARVRPWARPGAPKGAPWRGQGGAVPLCARVRVHKTCTNLSAARRNARGGRLCTRPRTQTRARARRGAPRALCTCFVRAYARTKRVQSARGGCAHRMRFACVATHAKRLRCAAKSIHLNFQNETHAGKPRKPRGAWSRELGCPLSS